MPGTLDLKDRRHTLLIDADDTLWENNIYFERAIANFISFLNHREYTPQQVRQVLNEVERQNVAKHGYGLHSFAHALVDTFERISVEPITPALHETIHGFAHAIAEQPMEIIPGVEDTLDYLHPRHRMIMLTKGNHSEQSRKVELSGLGRFFEAVEVVKEKDAATYRHIAEHYSLEPETTWMVGNSPKSDINPALAAGLNAIFVPHADTWVLEHEDVLEAAEPRLLLRLGSFCELRTYF